VDDQGLATASGRSDVRSKTFSLPFHIAFDSKIVETSFADRDDAGRIR
jgi:hypothetical protein